MADPINAPETTLTDTFNDAVTAPATAEGAEGTGGSGRLSAGFNQTAAEGQVTPALNEQNQVLADALEADLSEWNAEMHHRPEDKDLVNEVHQRVDTEQRLEIDDGLDFGF